MSLLLHDLVYSAESTYQAVEDMKQQCQGILLSGTKELDLKSYLKLTLSEVKPMTANGYFEITRGTLTAMISVRNNMIINS